MESIDLELGDLFDRDAVAEEGEDVGAQTSGYGDDEVPADGEGDEVLSNLKNLMKGAAKKKVLRPQPKLDADRLKTDRGLPALPKLFEDVQFAGRGHEAEDLKLLMSRLEHWAHRLFPKMSFDDFIERLEKLGSKKEIMIYLYLSVNHPVPQLTCVKRIRLDMPVTDSDFVSQTTEDIDEDPVDNVTAEEAFDEMMRSESDHRSPEVLHETPRGKDAQSHSTSPTAQTFSVEQRQRMERSRQLALERRAARLSAAAADDNDQRQPFTPDGQSDSVASDSRQSPAEFRTRDDDEMVTADDVVSELDNE